MHLWRISRYRVCLEVDLVFLSYDQSDCRACCKALISWREISHKTEIREVRGWRLSAIIHTLKSQYDWPILAEYRGSESVAYYWLTPDTDLSMLKFPPGAASLATQDGEEAA